MIVSIHRLLRAWPGCLTSTSLCSMFRSTGSYEPDRMFLSILTILVGFDPQALTSLTMGSATWYSYSQSFDPQALTSLTKQCEKWSKIPICFDPQALTSLTVRVRWGLMLLEVFRSTGSYEPDPVIGDNLVPENLVSIHRLLRAWPSFGNLDLPRLRVSIHRLLRAWPTSFMLQTMLEVFRSTGSYEPDPVLDTTNFTGRLVSIHRLLRAWPSTDKKERLVSDVSIHRLLRAWPGRSMCYR